MKRIKTFEQYILNEQEKFRDPALVSTPIEKQVKSFLNGVGTQFKLSPGEGENYSFLEFNCDCSKGKAKIKITFVLNTVVNGDEYEYSGDDYQSVEISNFNPQMKEQLSGFINNKPAWIENIRENMSTNTFNIVTKDVSNLLDWLYE